MKIGLSWKLFGVLLLNAAVIVGVMAAASHLSVSRNFEDYVREFDKERFEAVVEVLETEYAEVQNWGVIGPSPKRWLRGLGFSPPMMQHELFQPVLPSSERIINPEWVALGKGGMSEHQMMRRPRLNRQQNQRSRERPGLSQPRVGEGARDILILLDVNKNRIWGPQNNAEPVFMQALKYEGQVVGWLGMVTPSSFGKSRHSHFLDQQQRMLKIFAAVAVFTAAVIAFLLSRYLLLPVRKLAEGTRSIADRRFETRVDIRSSDEFGQLASDFNAMAETLDSFEQQRKQWISDISHELGTPLSVLRGEIEAMQDGIRKPGPERLVSLHAEVLHLTRIVNDLKLLSRTEAGQLNLNKVKAEPGKLLCQTLEQYSERLAERGISIQNQLLDQKANPVMIDPDRFRQVFVNLLENVARYVSAPGTLTVSSKSDSEKIVLILEDSGPGVSAEALPHLFDRFYRTDLSRNRDTGGSGLGLAICKNLIEAHGASIHAENVLPQGLRIVITIATTSDSNHQ